MALAVIESGGKQYLVSPGTKIKIEKINTEKAEPGKIKLENVLLKQDDAGELVIGRPYVSNSWVEAKVLKEGRDRKKIVFRYHSKTRYRKKKGHRQPYTEIEIIKIV